MVLHALAPGTHQKYKQYGSMHRNERQKVGQCFLGQPKPPGPHEGVYPVRRFEVVGKVRVESGNSLETFALAKVSRHLPIIEPALAIPKGQWVPRQGWSEALP